ncbi:MAG TPA: thioredoxin family protein, partial [Pirellulales bacterium]|nr:thioredoxin family protein [Pirellulales bacterium]
MAETHSINAIQGHPVVSHVEWLAARAELVAKEKEFTRLRDELSRLRRELPWEKVEKKYVFEAPRGKQTLVELFDGRSQLLVYHFMFDPSWTEGCKSCSFLADHYNAAVVHLNQRDVTLVTISRAPLEQLQTFEKRMGWTFKWVSSCGTDFNYDLQVSFTPQEMQSGESLYNYGTIRPYSSECPGLSVFFKDEQGNVFHTYSCYARGLDMLIGTYQLLDLVPKG